MLCAILVGVPAERWTRERRREQTRNALMDAAAEVFARRGFNGASLDDIADAAGYSRGAITFNFGSKEDLFIAVVERHNEALLGAYASLLSTQGQDADLGAIAEIWKNMEAGDVDTLCLVLELRLFALRNPDLRDKVAAFERKTEETVAAFIARQAAAAGYSLPIEAEELAAILYGATYGLQQHTALCTKDHRRIFEQFLKLVTPPTRDQMQART